MKTVRYTHALALASIMLCFSWFSFANAEEAGDNPQVRFLQSAAGTSFKDGKLTLISPAIVYFSDRPARLTGHMSCVSFVRLWADGSHSLQKDPPHAVLSAFAPNGRHTQTAVTLQNPRLEDSNLVYDVRVVKGTVPAERAEAELFIDDARMRGCGKGDHCFEAWGRPATMDIAPAEITDQSPVFFIGAGDGSAGAWTQP
jgi:hypothetical protein